MLNSSSLLKTLQAGSWDVIEYGWVTSGFPATDAPPIWTSTGSSNYTKVHDATVDKLLNAAVAATDPAAVAPGLVGADRQLTIDAVSIPVAVGAVLLAGSLRVANLRDDRSALGPAYDIAEWGLRS